ncbi:class I SAM-dependent methyltransferase [Hymenobacter humi]|uniref:Class I SAM-dependent methyltransferase n=1 Tax=Hymenobacter humi TaxID=1411620 RepID=A0ABW2U3L0_9BACT
MRQIQARQKARTKLPEWADNPDLIFPPALSVEQASSARTAAFKAGLVEGERLADLTGGFGADTAHFAARMGHVDYVERDPKLAAIVNYNLAQLGICNVTVHAADAVAFLKSTPHHYDWLYLDPARRDTAARKIFLLHDCEPDVVKLLPLLLHKADKVLLKTSPMLDIEHAVQGLGHVRRLWVLALDNEVKEVLYEPGPGARRRPGALRPQPAPRRQPAGIPAQPRPRGPGHTPLRRSPAVPLRTQRRRAQSWCVSQHRHGLRVAQATPAQPPVHVRCAAG